MSETDETPEWWSEVVDPSLASKADARRVIKLCREGEFADTWKPQWETFITAKGRIRQKDFERAQDILMGVCKPNAGRPIIHDWMLIEELVYEVAERVKRPINQNALRAEVSRLYGERHPRRLTFPSDTGKFKAKVREWISKNTDGNSKNGEE